MQIISSKCKTKFDCVLAVLFELTVSELGVSVLRGFSVNGSKIFHSVHRRYAYRIDHLASSHILFHIRVILNSLCTDMNFQSRM